MWPFVQVTQKGRRPVCVSEELDMLGVGDILGPVVGLEGIRIDSGFVRGI
jgi:hypothetical protein